MKTSPSILTVSLLSLCLALTNFSGCQQLQLIQRDPLAGLPKSSSRNPVKEIICLWEPAEGTGLDGKPCRGFAGQVLFFATSSEAPVLVNGTVEVYVFDNLGTEEEQSRPIETFTFTADQWDLFSRPNKSLGATYQIFIPYTRKGSHEANCSLRVKYDPVNEAGIPIYSKMASILLAGPKRPAASQAPQTSSSKAQSVTRPGSGLPPANLEELRQIAHSVTQPEQSLNRVTPAVGVEAQTAAAEDRDRLKRKMAEILGNAGTPEPETVPWKPETRTIRPRSATPADTPVKEHPLQGF